MASSCCVDAFFPQPIFIFVFLFVYVLMAINYNRCAPGHSFRCFSIPVRRFWVADYDFLTGFGALVRNLAYYTHFDHDVLSRCWP